MEYEIYRVDELSHSGVKGMRWGIRRYQNKDGSLTPAGKKRYVAEERKREEYEAEKQRVLKSGSAKEVLKFKGDLTQQEMQAAIQRIRWEQDMSSIAARDVEAGKKRVDAVVDDVFKYTTVAAKGYNMFANVYNAFSKSDVSLPKIDTNYTSGNRSERKAERDALKKANKITDTRSFKRLEDMTDDEVAAATKRAANEKLYRKLQEEGHISTKESSMQSQRDTIARRAADKRPNPAIDRLAEDAMSRRDKKKKKNSNPEVRFRMDRYHKK